MFVILNPITPSGGYLERRRTKKALERAEAVAHRTRSGLPFYVLDVPHSASDKQWAAVALKCTKHATRFIAPRELCVPDTAGVRRFIPNRLPQMLTLNTAVAVLKTASLENKNFSLTVCDRNAALPSELHRLLPLASTIRVITSRPERYAEACVKAFVLNGASVLLRQIYEPTTERDVVICADGTIPARAENAAAFTFGKKINSALCFSCGEIELLPEHKEIIPSCLDALDFAGAVYELCGSGEYSESVAAKIEIGGKSPSDSDPAECLAEYLGK